jgi:hypothetical protein
LAPVLMLGCACRQGGWAVVSGDCYCGLFSGGLIWRRRRWCSAVASLPHSCCCLGFRWLMRRHWWGCWAGDASSSLGHSAVAGIGQVDGGPQRLALHQIGELLWCGSDSLSTVAHCGRGPGDWSRLVDASFGGVTVAPMVGEAERICWWQQCKTTTNFGVFFE